MALDKKFWIELQKDVVPMFRRHVWREGKDIDDEKFDDYTPKYREHKNKHGAAKFKGTTIPGFTGQLHNSFGFLGFVSDGFKFGTTTHAGRVESLAKRGRVITNEEKVVPDHIRSFIMNQAVKYVFEEVLKKEIKGKTIRIKL